MEMYLDEILAMPGCERLREWCAIGPVQRAAFEDAARLLRAQAADHERERMCARVERHQEEARTDEFLAAWETHEKIGQCKAETQRLEQKLASLRAESAWLLGQLAGATQEYSEGD